MKQIYLFTIISLLSLNFLNAQTTFEWLTATINGNTISETIDGITATFTGTNDTTSDLLINQPSEYCGSSNKVIWEQTDTMSVSFSFSETVDITSILAMNGRAQNNTYTFTPTGGNNSPVVVEIVSGCAPTVDLNWTGITSFTISTPTANQFGFDNLVLTKSTTSPNTQTTFEWLTATINGNIITETIDGITATFTGTNDTTSDLLINQPNEYCGSSNNVIWEQTDTMSVSFSFSEAVDITSILAMNGRAQSNTYTFTPTGGNNSPVVVEIVSGCAPTVDLNWTGITSFTISTPTANQFGFDNLVLTKSATSPNTQTTFEWLTATINGNTISETIDGITATFTGTNDTTSDLLINQPNEYCGSSNNVIWEQTDTMSVSFSFSEAVDITSILAMNGRAQSNTYTFTPTGGNNSPVVVEIVSGCAPTVDLNWTGITSFTISTPTANQFGFDNLVLTKSATSPNTQTTFEWLTATINGNTISETIDGITATFTGTNDATSALLINQPNEYCGSSNNVIWEQTDTMSVSFSFSEAVDITSILAMNGRAQSNTYTFTPTGGNNSPVVVEIVSGCAPTVDLNWTGITSFTISTPTANQFGFDNLVLAKATLSSKDFTLRTVKVFPNPSSDFIVLNGLTAEEDYSIYNTLGLEVKKGIIRENEKIDIQNLTNGIYFLKFKKGNPIKFIKE